MLGSLPRKAGMLPLTSLCLCLAAGPSSHDDEWLHNLVEEADNLEPLIETQAVQELLRAVPLLEAIEPTMIYHRPGGGYLSEAFTRKEYAALSEKRREGLSEMKVDSQRFYSTFYGSPLASMRAFDLAAMNGFSSYDGLRILDFGFGSIGQLELLASCGAVAAGTEVMPLLRAMYSEASGPRSEGFRDREGSIVMVFDRWPSGETKALAGGPFDLFISKNTLKRGYVNPPIEVPAKDRMDLGVSAAQFLREIFDSLNPGGLALIYNLGGKPAKQGEAYRPATDIHCPWSKEDFEETGFEVVALDKDDSEMAREFGHTLGWDKGASGMDLDADLYALFTLVRRP